MSPRRAARIDATAPALVKLARELGALVEPLNDKVDCLLQWRGTTYVIDWKSKGGTLTPAQAKMVAQGWVIRFISTEAQLRELLLGK